MNAQIRSQATKLVDQAVNVVNKASTGRVNIAISILAFVILGFYGLTLTRVVMATLGDGQITEDINKDELATTITALNSLVSAVVTTQFALTNPQKPASKDTANAPLLEKRVRDFIIFLYFLAWLATGAFAWYCTIFTTDITGILKPIATAWSGAALIAIPAYLIPTTGNR